MTSGDTRKLVVEAKKKMMEVNKIIQMTCSLIFIIKYFSS